MTKWESFVRGNIDQNQNRCYNGNTTLYESNDKFDQTEFVSFSFILSRIFHLYIQTEGSLDFSVTCFVYVKI